MKAVSIVSPFIPSWQMIVIAGSLSRSYSHFRNMVDIFQFSTGWHTYGFTNEFGSQMPIKAIHTMIAPLLLQTTRLRIHKSLKPLKPCL
jgi:hypothetical protein